MVMPVVSDPSISNLSINEAFISLIWRINKLCRLLWNWRSLWLACLISLCIGAPYGWSYIAPLISRNNGVITSVETDWNMNYCSLAGSLAFIMMDLMQGANQGIVRHLGCRKSVALGSLLTLMGYSMISISTSFSNPIGLFIGPILLGCGISFCYIPSIQNAISRHSEYAGVVSGSIVCCFGASAIFFGFLVQHLAHAFTVLPDVILITEDNSDLQLIPSPEDLAELPFDVPNINYETEMYLKGTGSSCISSIMFLMGVLYGGILLLASCCLNEPEKVEVAVDQQNLELRHLIRQKEFLILAFLKASGTMTVTALLSTSKHVLSENFAKAFKGVLSHKESNTYAFTLVISGIVGRFIWPSIADNIRSFSTNSLFSLMFSLMVIADVTAPYFVEKAIASSSILYLIGFFICNIIVVNVSSGSFTCIIALCGRLYGTTRIHEIFGKICVITCWAAYLGPKALLSFREYSFGYEYLFFLVIHITCLILTKKMNFEEVKPQCGEESEAV